MDKNKLKDLINEIVDEECDRSGKYCILKEILLSAFKEPRFFFQIKCVEKFKFIKSEEFKEDIGWSKAWELWASEGYAKMFSDLYDENKSVSQLFKEIKNSKVIKENN